MLGLNRIFILFMSLCVFTLLPALDLERDILDRSMNYVGSGYQAGALGPQAFDCSGFIVYLYRGHIPNLPRVSRDIAQFSQRVSRSTLRPGDLVFFATAGRSDHITHVALFLGQNSVIHAISDGPDRGVTITSLTSNYWNRTFHSAGRVLPESIWQSSPAKQPVSAQTAGETPSAQISETTSSDAPAAQSRDKQETQGTQDKQETPLEDVIYERTYAKGCKTALTNFKKSVTI